MINKEVIVKALVAGSKLIEKDGKRTLIFSLAKPYPKTPTGPTGRYAGRLKCGSVPACR